MPRMMEPGELADGSGRRGVVRTTTQRVWMMVMVAAL